LIKKTSKKELRKVKHKRIRQKVFGTAAAPRLCVFKSLRHIYAQIIDDEQGKTLVAASTLDKELANLGSKTNKEAAQAVGSKIAARAKEKGITKVVFDRNGYKYHGNVAALADAARENGLEF